ncbi:MAG: DNA-directed RNA polymerase subunit alpha C-terminal domain-containing protein [Nitrospinota bacterium]
MTIISILILTSLILIFYFSYNASCKDGAVDYNELLKLGGMLLLVAIFIGLSIWATFFVIHSLSWVLVYILTLLKDGIFTTKVAVIISLLIINAGGAYILREQIRERKEGVGEENEEDDTPSESEFSGASETVVTEEEVIDAEVVLEDSDDPLLLAKEISISERLSRVLYEAGIKSVSDLTSMTEEELGNVKNIGDKSLEEIKEAMVSNGFSLKKED